MPVTDGAEPFGQRPFWRTLLSGLSHGVDHEKVFTAVRETGGATGGYVMMSVLSSAIATLGLLLSSPAVVIGAMLISPLMGPIILLGFAFWMVDLGSTRRALVSLALGLGCALVVAVALTWLSPLKEPTAEILARTRPNLFDLLVAAFSGVAGGYAVIRQRGEAVIGVAIATALMPPIATVGFGLGIADASIALGALLLFATNFIAIALAAGLMAALHGFHPHLARRGWMGHAAVVVIVVVLCFPLTLSLNTIALESRATVVARTEIETAFGPNARVTSLTVRSVRGGVDVSGLVATPKYLASAASQIEHRLQATLGAPTHVRLDQIVLADPQKFVAEERAPAQPPDPSAVALHDLHDALPFPARAVAYDPDNHRAVVLLEPGSGLDLPAAMSLEKGLQARPGLDGTIVMPPVTPLPPIAITSARGAPPQFGPNLAMDAWALQRWRVGSVAAVVCGLSSRDFRLAEGDLEDALKAGLSGPAVVAAAGDRNACAGEAAAPPFVLLHPS